MTIAHIENDPLWGESVEKLIAELPGVVYVGRARDGRAGLALCREKRPAMVLLALALPDLDGYVVLDHLHSFSPASQVILLSRRADDYTMYRVARDERLGLIVKSSAFESRLREALAAAAGNDRFLCGVAREAMQRFRRNPNAFNKLFSEHEITLLADFAVGLSDAEIARQRNLSPHTVLAHRTRAMAKLGVHGTNALIHAAAQLGFQTQPGKLAF